MRQELWDALAPLRQRREKLPVKWVQPENIHLSLKFLGDVDAAREPELRAALKHAAGTLSEPQPLRPRPVQHQQLVPQGEHLKLQDGARARATSQGQQ